MAGSTDAFPDCLKNPLVVGISGHVDILTPESEIAKRLEVFWARLRELAGPDAPFILLSSIAAGADHLAVKYRPSDVKYCAVLPFDEVEYRKDFSSDALPDFENELKNADKIIRCDAAPGDYSAASDYIRRHSDILLTMWDGYESLVPNTSEPKKGGTYYQILAALQLKTPPPEPGEKGLPVVNLSVKREKDHAACHKELGERKVAGFSEECSLSVLEWDRTGSKLIVRDFLETCGQLTRQEETKKVSGSREEPA